MYKINKISKFAFCLLATGIILLILMILSIIGAFASVGSDQQIEPNIFYGPLNQTSTINKISNTNTYTINNNNLAINNKNEEIDATYQFDVFKSEYKNETDEPIIKSDNGDNLVAPGASNAEDVSTFVVLNDSNKEVYVDLVFKLEYSDDNLPLKFKVIDPDGKYLLGSESLYEDSSKINGISQNIKVPAGEFKTYKFPWYWQFEEGQDARDTLLGHKVCTKPLTVTLCLKGEEPSPVPPGPEPAPEVNPSASTGDIISGVLLGMLSVAVIIGTFVIIKRNKRV